MLKYYPKFARKIHLTSQSFLCKMGLTKNLAFIDGFDEPKTHIKLLSEAGFLSPVCGNRQRNSPVSFKSFLYFKSLVEMTAGLDVTTVHRWAWELRKDAERLILHNRFTDLKQSRTETVNKPFGSKTTAGSKPGYIVDGLRLSSCLFRRGLSMPMALRL